MATVSFKADDNFKDLLALLAEKKGINTSAYIKLVLTRGVKEELSELTENGLTVTEELQILASEKKGKKHGPFKTPRSLMNALRK